jgi:hypothetical protein
LIDIFSYIAVNKIQKIVTTNPIDEKTDAAKFLLLLILDVILQNNINSIEIIKIIDKQITTNIQPYPISEACSFLTNNIPIMAAAIEIINNIKMVISIHFEEKLLQELQQKHKTKHIFFYILIYINIL